MMMRTNQELLKALACLRKGPLHFFGEGSAPGWCQLELPYGPVWRSDRLSQVKVLLDSRGSQVT